MKDIERNEIMNKWSVPLYKDAMEAAVIASAYHEEVKALRAFAKDIMSYFPDHGLEGDELQEIAVKHGLLRPEIRHEPCGESCNCMNYVCSSDWAEGVECYRKTPLLTGEI